MSLAVLTIKSNDANKVHFKIDTGTNKYYYLKFGKSITEINGAKWVDDIIFKTKAQENKKSHPFFDSTVSEQVDVGSFNESSLYVQLFTFKDSEGKSPSYSKVIKVSTRIHLNPVNTLSLNTSVNNNEMQTTEPIKTVRKIPHCDANKYAMQSSFEDILAGIVRVAGPLVTGILNGIQNTPGTGGSSTPEPASPALGMFNTILDAFLRGINNVVPATTPAPPSTPATAAPHSISFAASRNQKNYSRQFIFGIDDALIASLAGPILQIIPQLVGSHNQVKLQNRQMTNKLVTDLVADVNRRMMLQQFLQAQQAPGNAAGGGANVAALLQLLQQAPQTAPEANPALAAIAPTAVAPVAVAPVTAAPASLDEKIQYVKTLSNKAVLTFEHGSKQIFFGKEKHLFQNENDICLKVKLNVVEPAPKNPLSKAIINLTFKDYKKNTFFEKAFKLKDVKPNTILELYITKEELQKIPVNECIAVVAEMKWLTNAKRVFSVLGSTEIIFVRQYFIKEQGGLLSESKELSDMNVYRAFWNKIWESPVLDKVKQTGSDNRKIGWELDGNLKYTFAITGKKETNGIMETKQLVAKKDEDRVRDIINSRMKSGIELSINELNKMSTLWKGFQPLADEKMSALKSSYIDSGNVSEFIANIKLKGKDSQRGLVWVVPILKQQTFILSKPKAILPSGEIQETELEEVKFPMPYAVRILGLRTDN